MLAQHTVLNVEPHYVDKVLFTALSSLDCIGSKIHLKGNERNFNWTGRTRTFQSGLQRAVGIARCLISVVPR
jgi:hypothetical protein